jgi:hypothetical protein
MDKSLITKLVAGAGVALVAALAAVHYVDARRDALLAQLHGEIGRDSSARVIATQRSDSAIANAAAAAATVAHADSEWHHATTTAAQVPRILSQTVHDTVKIQELVYVVDTLVARGDSLEHAAIADTMATAQLRQQLIGERTTWELERADLAKALKTSESQHRHWGLGFTLGPTMTRDPGGFVRIDPLGLNVGVTYRW